MYIHGNDFPVNAACVMIPENASIARRPFFNSFTLYRAKSEGLAPSLKGSNEKSPITKSLIVNTNIDVDCR